MLVEGKTIWMTFTANGMDATNSPYRNTDETEILSQFFLMCSLNSMSDNHRGMPKTGSSPQNTAIIISQIGKLGVLKYLRLSGVAG